MARPTEHKALHGEQEMARDRDETEETEIKIKYGVLYGWLASATLLAYLLNSG